MLSLTLMALVLPLGLRAQTAPDAAELTNLLKEFLAGASRNDAAIHDRFWAEDLIYTGSSGRRVGKADILRDLRAAPARKPGDPTTTYTAEDIRIQQYGDTAIVAFRLVGTTEKEGKTEVAQYLNTGTFLKRNGKWQAVAWQATRMPPPAGVAETEVSAQVMRVADMNTAQIRALDRSKTVVLLPGGILEEHGPYLPAYTDGLLSERLTQELAQAIAAKKPGWRVLIFPQVALGASGSNELGGHFVFPGTYAVRPVTLRAVFLDLSAALVEQ
jgi:ketosteroid isomerase-like protein